ncbi:hypothetical protein [Desulfovibrio sp.]|nr:hypothetical protein [Desulfovibrio sp.]
MNFFNDDDDICELCGRREAVRWWHGLHLCPECFEDEAERAFGRILSAED